MRKFNYDESVILLPEEDDGVGVEIPRRYDVEADLSSLGEDYDWQVTYKFTSDFRPNKFVTEYGSPGMTYRRLYEILCGKFNGGVYFIDTYFNDVYPYTIKSDLDNYLKKINDTVKAEEESLYGALVKTKAGLPDRRYRKGLKALSDYKALASDFLKDEGRYFAARIKDDIIQCLEDGRIPLMTHYLEPETLAKRRNAGLPAYPRFFASGEFINNIQVFIRLEGRKWQKQHFIPTRA